MTCRILCYNILYMILIKWRLEPSCNTKFHAWSSDRCKKSLVDVRKVSYSNIYIQIIVSMHHNQTLIWFIVWLTSLKSLESLLRCLRFTKIMTIVLKWNNWIDWPQSGGYSKSFWVIAKKMNDWNLQRKICFLLTVGPSMYWSTGLINSNWFSSILLMPFLVSVITVIIGTIGEIERNTTRVDQVVTLPSSVHVDNDSEIHYLFCIMD